MKLSLLKSFILVSIFAQSACSSEKLIEQADPEQVANVERCSLRWTKGANQFTLNTKETGGASFLGVSTSNKDWTVKADDLRIRLQDEGQDIWTSASKILWAECNPRTGKTVVVTELKAKTKNGRNQGVFIAHAKWATVEAFTLPLNDGSLQVYLENNQTPATWYAKNPSFKTNFPGAVVRKLQNIFALATNGTGNSKFNPTSGFWKVQLPPADFPTARPDRLFYFQTSGLIVIKHADKLGTGTVTFRNNLDFGTCQSTAAGTKRLCGGKGLLTKVQGD